MNKTIFKKVSLLVLIFFLLVSFSFITGFTEEEQVALQGDPEETEYTKWVCYDCGYIYDPVEGDTESGIEPGTVFEDLPEDWKCPDCSAGTASFTELELILWVCPYCGFIYDENQEEILLEDLPEDWKCPVCQTSKDDFMISEDYQEYVGTDPGVAHLQHVLKMKSKHILVLQGVIEKHLEKDPNHGSINGLMNALSSSLKTVLKSKEKIDKYISQLMEPEEESVVEENTGEDEQNGQTMSSGNENTNNSHTNNGKSDNKDKNSQKGKKEHKNNGKAKGKNK